MPYSDAIIALRKEIESHKREIEAIRALMAEKEDVLRRLYQLQERQKKWVPGVIDSARQEAAQGMPSGQTLMQAVQAVIASLGDEEFQVTRIEELLKTVGFHLGGKYPRSRISTTLERLAKDGAITRTFEGKGSAPHRYRATRQPQPEGASPA